MWTEGSTAADLLSGERASSLVEILQWRAAYQPDRLAYTFLTDGESEESYVTYSEVDQAAKNIAARLQEKASPGDRAVLLYPSGRDFLEGFFGCLYAGIVAVPLYPPRPNRTLSRLVAVIENSGAKLALTQKARLGDLASHWAQDARLKKVEYFPTDDIERLPTRAWHEVPIASDHLAYLQYTSGSTSRPKGVMVTHGNLIYNCAYMREAYGLSEDTVSVTWVPHFHDLGLIDGLLSPLFTGFPAVVLSPAQFAQRPALWVQTISRFGATHSGGPNFAYDLCVRKVKPEQCQNLDLSSWSLAFSGAEPVRKETLDRFTERFSPYGFRRESFYPAYGLAEATLMVTGGAKSAGPVVKEVSGIDLERGKVRSAKEGEKKVRSLVGCGRVRRETKIAIVDSDTFRPSPPNAVGEIWIGGPTLAAGYWQRDDETRNTFHAFLDDGDEGPFLRTGDLGFLDGDELYITGRLKDMIIVRGGNYYPQDIEWAAEEAHSALRQGCGAAFGVEVDGEERLVIVQEIDRRYRKASITELDEIAGLIRQAVANELEIDTYCVQLLNPGGVHKTSSGKIQRHACRADFLAGHLDVIWESWLWPAQDPPSTNGNHILRREDLATMRPNNRRRALIEYIRQRTAGVLGVMEHFVVPDKPLGSLGLDSLKGNELTALLQRELRIELSNTMVWNYPTIAQIAAHIAEKMGISLDRTEPYHADLDRGARSENGYRPADEPGEGRAKAP